MFDLVHYASSRSYTPRWDLWSLLSQDDPPSSPTAQSAEDLYQFLCDLDRLNEQAAEEEREDPLDRGLLTRGWAVLAEIREQGAVDAWRAMEERDRVLVVTMMHRANGYDGPVPPLSEIAVSHCDRWEGVRDTLPNRVLLTPEQARHLLRGGEPMDGPVEILTGEDTAGQVMVTAESTYWSEVADPGPIVEPEEHRPRFPALQGLALQLFPSAWAALGGRVASIEIAEHHQLVLR